jgi:hypothetical protein
VSRPESKGGEAASRGYDSNFENRSASCDNARGVERAGPRAAPAWPLYLWSRGFRSAPYVPRIVFSGFVGVALDFLSTPNGSRPRILKASAHRENVTL